MSGAAASVAGSAASVADARRSRNNIMMSQTLPARINYPRDLDLSEAAAPISRSQSGRPHVPASGGAHPTKRSPSMTVATIRPFFQPPADKSADPAVKLTLLIMILHYMYPNCWTLEEFYGPDSLPSAGDFNRNRAFL